MKAALAAALAVCGCAAAAPAPTSRSAAQSTRTLPAAAPVAPAAACAGAAPNYQREVTPLLQRYCLTCHSPGGDAGEDHDFTRYEVLSAQRRQLGGELETGAMPPPDRPQPSREERELLELWACLGAPNN